MADTRIKKGHAPGGNPRRRTLLAWGKGSLLCQKLAYFLGHTFRVGDKGQVSAPSKVDAPASLYPHAQIVQALLGNQQVPVSGKGQGWHAHVFQPFMTIEMLDQPKAMSHDALVRLPALPGHKAKE